MTNAHALAALPGLTWRQLSCEVPPESTQEWGQCLTGPAQALAAKTLPRSLVGKQCTASCCPHLCRWGSGNGGGSQGTGRKRATFQGCGAQCPRAPHACQLCGRRNGAVLLHCFLFFRLPSILTVFYIRKGEIEHTPLNTEQACQSSVPHFF